MKLSRLLAAARGDEPIDLLLQGGHVVDVFTGEIHQADVAVVGDRIAGIGPGYSARETVDVKGRYVCPGLIDAHLHIESAMVPPSEFASIVIPRGITAVVTDPHEIANVLGIEGIRFMLRDAEQGALSVFVNASSCVPATHLASSGADLSAADLSGLLDEPRLLGLAEVMNFPGVVNGDEAVLAKIEAFAGRPVDGHCPGLTGLALNAYVSAGIESDHECVGPDEAREKLHRGMTVFIREGSVARNLHALLPLINATTERRFCLCTDDKQVPDLIEEGSVDHMIRVAIEYGLDPVTALRMSTLNVAEHFRFRDRGAIAPGRRADLLVVDDLKNFRPSRVWIAGREVAANGKMLAAPSRGDRPVTSTMNVDWSRVDLTIPAAGSRVRTIGVIPDQITTEALELECKRDNGSAVAAPEQDLLKMAVIERHRGTGRVGLGFVKGMGLRRGAIAGTVAHDHHNLVVIGADDESMMTAARAVADAGGGLAAAEGGSTRAVLPLRIAGLMSDRPYTEVAAGLNEVIDASRSLGSALSDPFMTMSFLGLEVIPTLKLTDQGLVDVTRMKVVPLFVDEDRTDA